MAGETPIPGAGRKLNELLVVVRELRERCPWDREQKLGDSAKYLIEEAYEAADAIADEEAREGLAEELGDLMVQVLFAGVIAEEQGLLQLDEMIGAARDKLVRRHPHVYGDTQAASVGEVLENWRLMKQEERRRRGAVSALDGVARGLPALLRAEKLGERAREAGMDWPDVGAVLDKVSEELEETRAALAHNDHQAASGELGDMLLALANAPRFIHHNAEETLRSACDKFVNRFKGVEALAAGRRLDLKELAPDEVEGLWQEVKRSFSAAQEK